MIQNQHALSKAIVTGGAQGIGFAITNQLVAEGCKSIALIGRDKEKGAKAVAKLEKADAEAIFISADISDEKSALSAVEQEANLDYPSRNEALTHLCRVLARDLPVATPTQYPRMAKPR